MSDKRNYDGPKPYILYRATQDNKGCAFQWQLSYKPNEQEDKWQMFLEVAKQATSKVDGNHATYDWGTKITVKLGPSDVGELISVLEGRKDFVGQKGSIYHSTANGNKVVQFGASESNQGAFEIKVSAQDANKKSLGSLYQTIYPAEASVLLVLLRTGVQKMFGW